MIVRCRELDLRAVGPERKLIMEFTVLVDRQDGACAVRPVAPQVDRAMKRLRVLVLDAPAI